MHLHPQSPARTRSRLATRLVAGALVVALAVAGCSPFGGSASTAAPGTPAPTAEPTPSPTPKPTPTPLTPGVLAQLDATLAAQRAAAKVPGIQAVISFDNGWTWNGANGQAIVASKTPVQGSTLFEIGSVTKTFVAAAVMQLVDEGVVSLDDPVTKWLPTTSWSNVTVRMLLSHTSGIGDYFRNATFMQTIDRNKGKVFTVAQVLAAVPKQVHAPGADFAYTNTGFVLLGQIIAAATGKPAAQVIRERFLDPLGLTHTFMQGAETPTWPLAHGYDPAPKGKSVGRDLTGASPMLPFVALATAAGDAGAMVSTASDLARWAEALYGGRVVSAQSLRLMTDFNLTLPFKPRYIYGLGTMQYPFLGRESWGHSGRISGFFATMRYIPSLGATVTVLVNAGAGDPDVIAAKLLAVAFPAMGIPLVPPSPAGSPEASTAASAPPGP